MIYKDAIQVVASHTLSKESGDFLTKVILKGSKDNFARIHVYEGIAFCISAHRLHGEKLGIPDGIYDYTVADGVYKLVKHSEADVSLGEYLKATQLFLVYPVKMFALPDINITAARSLAKNGMIAGMAYNLMDGLMRFIGFYPNPGIEAYDMDRLAYINPEYLYDATITLGMEAESSMSANRRYVQLWNRNQFVIIACVNPKLLSDTIAEFPLGPESSST